MTRDEKLAKDNERPAVAPRVDVFENDKEILLLADLPGVTKEGLSIQAEGDTLSLHARRDTASSGAVLAQEYQPVDFARSFNIPPTIDRDKIEAKLVAGVLELHLPKQPVSTPKKIPVRTS